MKSRFLLQIIDRTTGEVVQWEPGLSVEVDFVTDCISRVCRRGVGFFRSSKHVAEDIEKGIEEAIHVLKLKVKPAHQVED